MDKQNVANSYNRIVFYNKKSKTWSKAITYMNLKNTVLNERSQSKRPYILFLHVFELSRIDDSIETEM